MVKRILDGLSNIAPNLFEAEVGVGLSYAVVIFNLHLDDVHRAAFLGAAVLVFTLLQGVYKLAEGRQATPVDPASTKGV